MLAFASFPAAWQEPEIMGINIESDSQEQKRALAEAGTAVPLQGTRAAIAEPSTRAAPAIPDQMAASADQGATAFSAGADVAAASSDRSLKVALGERAMATVPVEPNTKPKSAEVVPKLAAVDPDAKKYPYPVSAF